MTPFAQNIPIGPLAASLLNLPTCTLSASCQLRADGSTCGRINLHLCLVHDVNELELALGHLYDFLDQTGANLVLDLLDPKQNLLLVTRARRVSSLIAKGQYGRTDRLSSVAQLPIRPCRGPPEASCRARQSYWGVRAPRGLVNPRCSRPRHARHPTPGTGYPWVGGRCGGRRWSRRKRP